MNKKHNNHNNNTKIIIDSQNINAIGKVVDKDTNKELSEITPLIMIVNASSKNVQKEIDDLLRARADPDLEINYYNQQTTARKLALLYRKNIKFP